MISYKNYHLLAQILAFTLTIKVPFLPASPKAKAGLGVQSLRPSVRPSVHPKILSSQLLWNYWSNYHETWYVDRTSYGVMHIDRNFWSPHICWIYVPWNLENTYKWPCHCNSSETTDPFIMKLGMQIEHHMVLCMLARNFDPLIFVGVMPLGTYRLFVNQLTI